MKLGTPVEYRTRSGKKRTGKIDAHKNTGQGFRLYRVDDHWFDKGVLTPAKA